MAPESNTPNANAPIRQNVAVPKPDAGANVTIDSSAGGQLQLGFDPSVATPTRSGNDLTFDVEGGGKVTVKDFFAVGDESLPSLRLPDGTVVASTDFFSGSGLDMTTAAGPGGGAGGAGSGSGDYRDDAGNLIGGIDRFGKLGTDFWGRGSEVPDPWIGDERPGGDFGFDTQTGFDGDLFSAGVYEDALPNQHKELYRTAAEADAARNPGQIYFNFTPTGTTTVTEIRLSGFDVGTKIRIGDGPWIEVTDTNQVFRFTEDMFNTNVNDSSHSGVYIWPPVNSDHDMTINATVDIRTAGGQTGSMSGTFTVIVDAVADKPGLESDFAFDPMVYDGSTKVHESDRKQEIKGGWAKDDLSVHDKTLVVKPQDVDLTAKLHVTITFGDFSDASERHFGLVEIPSSANIFDKNGNPYSGAAGTWNMDPASFPAGMLKPGSVIETVRIWYDAQGNVVGEGANAPAGASEYKDFFRFEVDNGYLKAHMDDPNDIGSRATIDVELDLTGTGTGIIDDVTFKLDAGAQAVDKAQDGELDPNNNVSYTWNTDEGGAKTDLNIDVVNSKLEVRVGWASEGGHDDKHMAHGGTHQPDAYEPKIYDDATNDGRAPVNFSINDPNSDETIESIKIDYNAGRGTLVYNPADFPTGTVFTPSNGSLVITFPAGSDVDAVISKIWFNPTPGSFDYRETELGYTVVVRNDAGAHTEYKGTTTLVVDAVADKPGITADALDYGKNADNEPYTAAKPEAPVKFNFTLNFPDDSDGESHYMYVQYNTSDSSLKYDSIVYTNAANQQVTLDLRAYVASGDPADLPAGVTVVNGYFKVNVPDTQDSIDVTLTVHSDKTSGTAHYEINYGASAEVKTDFNETPGHDYEYDKGNNYAATGSKGFLEKFGPGSPNDPVDPNNPNNPEHPDNPDGPGPDVPPMEFDVDPVNCKLVVDIRGTFEGNAANHHLDPTDTTSPRVDPNGYDGSIRFSLEGAADNEYISDLYLKFDTKNHGQVTFGTHVLDSPVTLSFAFDEDTGTYVCITPTFEDMTLADLSNGSLKYTPFDDDHSDDDLHFDYAVSIVDPDSGDTLIGTNMDYADASAALGAAARGPLPDADIIDAANGTLVVDAVADLSSKVDTDGTSLVDGPQSGVEHTEVEHKDEMKGYETDTFGSKAADGDASNVTVHVKTTFADVSDGSESHYILIQHLDGWKLELTPAQIAAGYKIVLDPLNGEPENYKNNASPDPDAVYYRILVPAGVAEVDQEFTLSMPSQNSDFDYSIQTGSLSVEGATEAAGDAQGGKEITDKNNEAVRFDSTLDGEADYVNSKLTVKTGWASESNNDAKHWGASSGAYTSNEVAGTLDGSTLEDGSHVNLGAPINFALDASGLPGGVAPGSHEYISSVTLSIASADAGRGTLMYLDDSGVAHSLSAGTITIDGNTYTVSVDGDKFTLTYNGAAASGPTAITGKLFFQPSDSVNNHDVTINYEVTVKNESGASVTYKDSGLAVMDAVADKPEMDITPVDYGKNADNVDYSAAKPGAEVKLQFTVKFPDSAEGSEEHTVYVQYNPKLHYDTIVLGDEPGYNFSAFDPVTGTGLPDGVTLIDGYFRFDKTPDAVHEIPVQVVVHGDESLTQTTTFTIDYGATAKAIVDDGDLEYDLANNYAATGTGDFMEHFGPGSPNDPTNDPKDPNKPDPNEPEPPMEFTVDPAWATLRIGAKVAYEGDHSDKNVLHTSDAPHFNGGAAIWFSLTGTDTSSAKEVVTQIYLEFSQGGSSNLEGVITLNGHELPTDGVTLTFDSTTGLCSLVDTSGNEFTASWTDLTNGNLKFVPAADSFTDIDVKVDYALTIVDPDSGDMRNFSSKPGQSGQPGLESHLAAADSTGHATVPASQGTVVVDAVADKPTATFVDSDGDGKIDVGYVGGDKAAQPGETVVLKDISVQFGDYDDNSETHYLMVQCVDTNPTLAGSDNQLNSIADQTLIMTGTDSTGGKHTLEMEIVDGKIVSITVDGELQGADSPYAKYLGDIPTHEVNGDTASNISLTDNNSYNSGDSNNDGTYFKIPVPNEFLQETEGKITTEVEIDVPKTKYTKDSSFDVKVGGMALESDLAGGEVTTDNNAAYDFNTAKVEIGVVTSSPKVTLTDNFIYENLTPNADDEYRDTPYTKSNGAKINIAGLDSGETGEITLTFSLKNGAILEPSQDPYNPQDPTEAHDSMRVEFNGKTYYAETADGGKTWTVTVPGLEGKNNGSAADAVLLFKPGYNYNSTDIDVKYTITVTDNNSHEEKTWNNMGDKTNGQTAQANPLEIKVDAVAQKVEFGNEGKLDVNYGRGEDGELHTHVDRTESRNVELKIPMNFQDITDGSELHFILVEAKPGYVPSSVTISGEGGEHTITITGTPPLQGYGDSVYYKIPVPNSVLNDISKGSGDVEVTVTLPTTENSINGESIRLGAVAEETYSDAEYGKNQPTGTAAYDNNNNTAVTISDAIKIYFDEAKGIHINAGVVFENDMENAHTGTDFTRSFGTEINFGTNDSDDEILSATFSYTEGEGQLYDIPADVWAKYVASGGMDDISQYKYTNGEPFTKDNKLIFIPDLDADTDSDPKVGYSITIKDPHSGDIDTHTSTLTIRKDAVADMPEFNKAIADPTLTGDTNGNGVLNHGETVTIDLAGAYSFNDNDGSEDHFVLIEYKYDSVLTVGGSVIAPTSDNIFVKTLPNGDTVSYYKIPVADLKDAGWKADYTVPKYHQEGEGTLKTGALAVEAHHSGSETNFHNNTAMIEGNTLDLNIGHGPGNFWISELYEENMPDAHRGDFTTHYSPVSLNWPADAETIEITVPQGGMIGTVDANGNLIELTTKVANGDGSTTYTVTKGENVSMGVSPDHAHKDNDLEVTFKFKDGSGGTVASGGQTVAVDAVADRPDAPEKNEFKGDTLGEVGENVYITVPITANFNGDTDGSEQQYILVEHVPGFDVVIPNASSGGYTVAETIYIDGHSYFKVPVGTNASSGTYDITLQYKPGSIGDFIDDATGTRLINEQDGRTDGVSTYKLQTGTLVVEENLSGQETDLSNNVAWNTGSDSYLTVDVSLVDSNISLSATAAYENNEGGASAGEITISGLAGGKHDILTKLSMSYNNTQGDITLDGVKIETGPGVTVETVGNSTTITWTNSNGISVDSLDGHLHFDTKGYGDTDAKIAWKAFVKDTLSGDVKEFGTDLTVVVDAVAHAPTVTLTGSGDDGFTSTGDWSSVVSGGTGSIDLNLHFQDREGGEKHYAVLEQDPAWRCGSVTVALPGGGTTTITLTSSDIVLGRDGNPYYALEIKPEWLDTDGKVNVSFNVTAPTTTSDASWSLQAGGLSIEQATGIGDKESDLNNNWSMKTEKVALNVGVVETKAIAFEFATLTEDASAGAAITLSNATATALTNNHEAITSLTLEFSMSNATGKATVLLNDASYEITFANGKASWTMPDGHTYDPATDQIKIVWGTFDSNDQFVPNHSGTGNISIIAKATVTDINSGDHTDLSQSATMPFIAMPDAAENLTEGTPSDPTKVADAHAADATVKFDFSFPDVDGSENHYLYFKVPGGMSMPDLSTIVTVTAAQSLAMGIPAGTYYRVTLGATASTYTGTFRMGEDYTTDEVQAYAVSQEKSNTGKYASTAFDPVSIDAPTISLNTAPVGAEAEVTAILSAAAAMHGSLDVAAMFTDAEHDTITPLAVSFGGGAGVTLDPSGSVTIDGAHGTLTVTGDGAGHYTYDYALHHGSSVATTDHDSFNFSGKDSYGADATSLGKLTFEFDEHHIVAQTTGGTLSAATEPHGVVIHGSDAADVITGSNHGDTIYGGAGNDEIHSGAGDDTIYAGSGDNLIHGGAGNDVMYSGSGDNTFLWLAEDFGTGANDTIRDFKLDQDIINFKDVFGANDSIDNLLDGASKDSVSRTVTFTSGGTTFEAEFKNESELVLTLKDEHGAVQTIDVHAAEGAHFYDSSVGDSLSEEAMRTVLEQMIKNNN